MDKMAKIFDLLGIIKEYIDRFPTCQMLSQQMVLNGVKGGPLILKNLT